MDGRGKGRSVLKGKGKGKGRGGGMQSDMWRSGYEGRKMRKGDKGEINV